MSNDGCEITIKNASGNKPSWRRDPESNCTTRGRLFSVLSAIKDADRLPIAIFITPWIDERIEEALRVDLSHTLTQLALITQKNGGALNRSVAKGLCECRRVPRVIDVPSLIVAIKSITNDPRHIKCLVTNTEELQVPLAEVRRELGIQGMRPRIANRFRDKYLMKSILTRAGIPCARYALVRSLRDAHEFAARVGFPIVLKPRAGMRSAGTLRVDTDKELCHAAKRLFTTSSCEALAEEYICGTEHSCDGITIDGNDVWQLAADYQPTPLDANRSPGLAWSVLLPREAMERSHPNILNLVRRSITSLGMKTGYSHLEWFRTSEGRLLISEIAARPPGAHITTLIALSHEISFFQTWMRLMTLGLASALPPRRYATAAVFLRGRGRRVRRVWGLRKVLQELGAMVVSKDIPTPGQALNADYEGGGSLIIRHQRTAVVQEAVAAIRRSVRIECT